MAADRSLNLIVQPISQRNQQQTDENSSYHSCLQLRMDEFTKRWKTDEREKKQKKTGELITKMEN